jgi:hypothetical protein
MPFSPGLEAYIQPEKMRCIGLSGRESSICTKAAVSGVSLCGVE